MKPASHRDQLVAMLCEAAEVEHCLMCTYLYGAFSLKQRSDEGLTDAELRAVRRWRATVIDIAIDEMLHLALVNNLLISLGATPHYGRFNFPINPGVFPADVAVALAPFDPDMLDHFIYLERPRESAERDGAIISKARYHRGVIEGRLMPFADDYDTVGELYEGIAASFAALEDQHAGAAIPLFIGPRSGGRCMTRARNSCPTVPRPATPCHAAAGRTESTRARDRRSGRAASGSWQFGVRIDAATDDFHAR